LTQKGELVERLQLKAANIGRILTNLEKKYSGARGEADMKKSPSGSQLGSKRASLKIQHIPPFNAAKSAKSPSSAEATSISLSTDTTPTIDPDEAASIVSLLEGEQANEE
jgi:hypothetical protein